MKFALINPNQIATYISSWVWDFVNKTYIPVYSNYEDSQLVCDISETEFDVAPPLFWMPCDDSVQTYQWYLDTIEQTINQIVNEPRPTNPPDYEQPQTNMETI